jgi:hypothetical protein
MTQADSFPEDGLQAIAADLADWLEGSELPATGVRIAAAPLPIWDVRPGASLKDTTAHAGEWHHQLLNEGGAFAYARSRVADGRARIIALGESPLVAAIEEILGELRSKAADPASLRLLRSQRHHTTCLWVHREGGLDEIIVLQSPSLRIGEQFDEQTFLERLASLPPPGMIATAPRDPRCRDVALWGEDRARPVRQVEH